jgi:soluble lytic murein transglycosylase-like protein
VQPPLNAVPSGAPTGPWPFRVNVSRWQPTVEGELSAARMTQGIDQAVTTELLLAMIAAESHGDPRAVSQARAVGLMQLMPNTFADHVKGADPFDPGMNVRAGLLYLNRALSAHDGDLEWALAGYHAGIGASLHARAGDDELWTETIRYVYGVLALRDSALVMRGKQPPPRAGSLKPAEVLTIAAVGR